MNKKLLFLIVGIACLLFCRCANHQKQNETKTVFRYNESAGIASLDPAFAKDLAMIWACNQLYNGLVQLSDDLKIEPAIAKRWEISPDGKKYTFYLRNDVFFHEHAFFPNKTRKVVASDFRYSFERILDESVASPGTWIFNHLAWERGKPALETLNDTTFVIHLQQPFSPFLGLLTMPYCSVVPPEIVMHYGKDFRQNPVGTGPFAFKLWKEGEKLVLLKNPLYFEKDEHNKPLPYLDAVSVTFIVDKQTVFLEFVKGNLDFLNSLDASYKDELLTTNGQLRPKYTSKIKMITQPYLNTEYLGFLLDSAQQKEVNPLQDKRIRQALNYGFDRRKMIRYLRNNIGLPGCYGMIPLGLPGFDSTHHIGYEYNPAKAATLLAEAGYPGGKGLPAFVLSVTSSYLDICKYIQQQLGLIGVNVKIDVSPSGALREQIAQSKSKWFRASWIADYPDAENYLSLFYSQNFCPAGPNYTHFKTTAFDRLYEKAQKETNDTLRAAHYLTMDSLIMAEAPVIVLYYDQVLRFTQPNIEGMKSNAMNLLSLKKVKKSLLD